MKNDLDFRLREASADDVLRLASWFGSLAEAEAWGGPRVRFPFTREQFDEDTAWRSLDSSVLVRRDARESAEPEMLGFGQIYDKNERIHLARLAVAPDRRGAGLGGVLIRLLIARGQHRRGPLAASLWVRSDNLPAIRCYEREGFVAAEPPPGELLAGARFMVRPA